ncbi:MAG: sulfotransferase [Planctomycetota bacterium]
MSEDDPFALSRPLETRQPTDSILEWSRSMRPAPGIFVTGVMVRSGTQYATNLIALHPHVFRHPREIWELPLLREASRVLELTEHFFEAYTFNRERLGPLDLMTLLGSGVIAYLQAAVPPGVRILLTHPGAHHLDSFYAMFPHEHQLLLMRDGRDVVASAHTTWPAWDFEDIVRTWTGNARLMLRMRDRWLEEKRTILFANYEEIVAAPEEFVHKACAAFGLDPQVFPYENIASWVRIKGSSTFEAVQKGEWEIRDASPDFKTSGRWSEWTNAEMRAFKEIAGPTLIECGYVDNDQW